MIAENVIILHIEDIVLYVVKKAPLLNSTVLIRIKEMNCYIKCELIKWIESSQVLLCKVMCPLMSLVFLFY
jgi:hypothetical protein